MIALHICFSHIGFKWPLRDQDAIEVWTSGHELIATLPGHLIRHLIELHLGGAALQGELQALVRPPLAKIRALDPHHQQTLRQQRRSRRPRR